MKKIVYIFLFLSIPVSVDAYTFARTLTVGSQGDDVLQLQKILNTNQATQVALEGPGSTGSETTYFGELTKQAVIKFQNQYPQEILLPNNLLQGTGFVGNSTIALLNTIQTTQTPSTNIQIPAQTITPVVTTPIVTQTTPTAVTGFTASPTFVPAGNNVYVGSESDLSSLTFYLNTTELTKKCYTIYTCELPIPSNQSAGITFIQTSDSRFGSFQITIIDSSNKKPEVDINRLSLTSENTITGKNFAPEMRVYTPYGMFDTATVNDSFILQFPQTTLLSPGTSFFFVENKNGLQSDIVTIPYEK